jgi:hypothetical protein
MTTVNSAGVNGVTPFATDFTADAGGAALSPEGLLYYCQSRLGTLDANIKQYFDEQQKRNAEMKDASKLMELLREGTWGSFQVDGDTIKGSAFHCENHANKANEILALWRSTSSPEVKEQCAAAFKQVSGHDVGEFAGPDMKVTGAQVQAAAGNIKAVDSTMRASQLESIKEVQTNMSKSAEMNMIQLQALVSQRQLAVQLTTQLMQTAHETSKQVVGNIR